MKYSLAALPFSLCLLVPPAAAQQPRSAYDQVLRSERQSTGELLDDLSRRGGSDHWSRCAARDYLHPQVGIRSCGRVIGERFSRTHSAAAHLYRGNLLESTGRADEARTDYSAALQLFDEIARAQRRHAPAQRNRAIALTWLRRYDEALAASTTAIEIAAQRPGVAYTHETLARPQARDEEADRHALAEEYAGRAWVHFHRGDYAGAIADYDEAARLWSEASIYAASRCEARAAARRELEVAAAICEEALHLGEGSGHALFARGYLRFMQEDYEGAWADFSAAAEDNSIEYAGYGRGVAAVKLGRIAEGQSDIAEAMAQAPFVVAYYASAGLRP